MSAVEVTASTGRYLSAILLVSATEGRPAKTGEIADRLGVSPASVTEMLTTLQERGLVTYEKYRGARLTPDGEAVTRELMWKHCLADNFMEANLDLDPTDARQFGHALSDESAAALRRLIDHPCDGACGAPHDEYSECTDEVQEQSC